MHHFTKTGSGQTQGKLKIRVAFPYLWAKLAKPAAWWDEDEEDEGGEQERAGVADDDDEEEPGAALAGAALPGAVLTE
eukprot:COSAG06_NODE_14002_length_1198_cov_1.442220_2_plen_78_part_00